MFIILPRSLFVYFLLLDAEGLLGNILGRKIALPALLPLLHQLLDHSVEVELGLALDAAPQGRFDADGVGPRPLHIIFFGSLHLGKDLGVPYFLSLLLRVGDHGLGVGVLEDEGSFRRPQVFLASSGVSEYIKLEYYVAVV